MSANLHQICLVIILWTLRQNYRNAHMLKFYASSNIGGNDNERKEQESKGQPTFSAQLLSLTKATKMLSVITGKCNLRGFC